MVKSIISKTVRKRFFSLLKDGKISERKLLGLIYPQINFLGNIDLDLRIKLNSFLDPNSEYSLDNWSKDILLHLESKEVRISSDMAMLCSISVGELFEDIVDYESVMKCVGTRVIFEGKEYSLGICSLETPILFALQQCVFIKQKKPWFKFVMNPTASGSAKSIFEVGCRGDIIHLSSVHSFSSKYYSKDDTFVFTLQPC